MTANEVWLLRPCAAAAGVGLHVIRLLRFLVYMYILVV